MIGSWELQHIDKPKQFIAFAKAYLESSSLLCLHLESAISEQTYPKACVILFLAFHAVELFLKGAIINRLPDVKLHHDIKTLKRTYDDLYQGKQFSWNIPFKMEYLGFEPDKIIDLENDIPFDQIYRYPTSKKMANWKLIAGFDAALFRADIENIKVDFIKLEKVIFDADSLC